MARKPIGWPNVALALMIFSLTGCQGTYSFLLGKIRLRPDSEHVATQTKQAKVKKPSQETAPAIQQVSARSVPKQIRTSLADRTGPVEIGLSEAIDVSLRQNPDLAALRGTEPVSAAAVGVAAEYPFNPVVQTRILPFGHFKNGLGDTSVYNYVLLWQTFELAHQRHHRKHNAQAQLDVTRWTIHQAELQSAALTLQLYLTALYQKGLGELAREAVNLNEQLLDITQKRFEGGGASAADLALVRLDTRAARQQSKLADITYENAILALRRQLNLPATTPLNLTGKLSAFRWHPLTSAELCKLTGSSSEFSALTDEDSLVNQLAGKRPDIIAARAQLDATRANLNLAKAQRIPNLRIGPFYIHDAAATVNYGLQAEMEIPVCRTGKPLVHQREAEFGQQNLTVDQMTTKASLEIRTALDRYKKALALPEITSETEPQLPSALQKLEQAFKAGEIDILRISQARNSLIQYQRARLDSLNELAQSSAALVAASGLPPLAIISCRAPVQLLPQPRSVLLEPIPIPRAKLGPIHVSN